MPKLWKLSLRSLAGMLLGLLPILCGYYFRDRLNELLDGDNVLVWDFTSLYYLNKDVNIASYTTISTPTYYVDSLKKYWSNNPDKYPDVIAVSVWFGDDYRMEDCDHFLDWIENEFDADEVVEKEYYRYYIRRR